MEAKFQSLGAEQHNRAVGRGKKQCCDPGLKPSILTPYLKTENLSCLSFCFLALGENLANIACLIGLTYLIRLTPVEDARSFESSLHHLAIGILTAKTEDR